MNKNQKRIWNQLLAIGTILFLWFFLSSSNTLNISANFIDWVNMHPSPHPPARGYHAMAYDIESDVVIVFSGAYRIGWVASCYNDTWAYSLSSNTWTNMSPSEMPAGGAPRGEMAYDSKNDVIILFGGWDKPETWAYDYNSNTWTNRTPSISPPGRDAHGTVYDTQSERIIIFGGRRVISTTPLELEYYNDTWAYDYTSNTWTDVTPALSPEARCYHNLVYDSLTDRVILFGGGTLHASIEESLKADTWIFDLESRTWTEQSPSISPSPRAYSSMAYDIIAERTILYGGSYGRGGPYDNDVLLDDTWTYDYATNNWTEMNINSPGNRMRHSIVYASTSDKVVLFGGQLNDEWGPYNAETWFYIKTFPSLPLNLGLIALGVSVIVVVLVVVAVLYIKRYR